MKDKKQGFTIVELLIVIVVIGILAAISIVAYNGIQNRANDASIRSDLAAAAKKVELWKADSSSGLYPQANSDLNGVGFKVSTRAYDVSRGNFYYCPSTDRTRYAIGAVSKSGQGMMLINGAASNNGNVWLSTTCAAANADPALTSGGTSGFNATTWQVWTGN